MPWIDIFKHDATYTAEEITEWVVIDTDCYNLPRKFQLKPDSSPWFTPCAIAIAHLNHYFHQYHRNATPENKKMFCDSCNYCKSPQRQGTIMLKQLVTLLHISLSGIVTSGGFATAFLTGGSLLYLFNGPEVLTTSTDKARNFPCNSTLDDGSQQISDFSSRT